MHGLPGETKMKLRTGWAIALTLLCGAQAAEACSCVIVQRGCGPLEVPGDAVFLGTVVSKEVGFGLRPDGLISSVVPSRVRFAVTDAFRGVSGKEIEIETTEGCCACGYPFEVGRAYLVYAHLHEGKLKTSSCSWTVPAVLGAATIQQYRAKRAGITAPSLFGLVTRVPQDARIEGLGSHTPVAGITMRIRGNAGMEFTSSTSIDGVYEFRSLPPDTYELEPLLPATLTTRERATQKAVRVTIENAKTCEQNVQVFADGVISGQAVTPAGEPLEGFLTIEPADAAEREAARKRGGLPGFETGADGRFELSLLWPGKYRLKFMPKIGGMVRFDDPAFYPDVISLGEGQHVTGLRFVVGLSGRE